MSSQAMTCLHVMRCAASVLGCLHVHVMSPFESIGDVRSKPDWRPPAPLYCYEKNCCPHPIAPSSSQTRANKYHGHAGSIMAHQWGQGERASETATRDQSMKRVYDHGPADEAV